jgi:hypothetical protein
LLARVYFDIPTSFHDSVREVVDKNGTKFRPFLLLPKAHFEEPFHHPYIIGQARRVRERIKNIRKGLVKGKTVAECEAELDRLREVSDCIWEANKARAYWWASLLYFLDELGLLSFVSSRTDLQLELPAIVLAIANPALIAQTKPEAISDAIERFNKAWIGNGLRPPSKYARARELDKEGAQIWRRLARRHRALKRAGKIVRELNGEAVIPQPPSLALQAKRDVHQGDPVTELQRLLKVRADRALLDERMRSTWLAAVKEARARLSDNQRATLLSQLRAERLKAPESIDPRTVYEALRREDQRLRPNHDQTDRLLQTEVEFGNTITNTGPSDYEMREDSLAHAVNRDVVARAWAKWTSERSTWHDDIKAEAQKAAIERREWAELLGTEGRGSKSSTKTQTMTRLAA